MPATLLIVDDEKHTREGLQVALEDQYDVYLARDADEAFRLLEAEKFDVVLTDLRMAGKSGLKVIDHVVAMPEPTICIMMTAYGNVETAVEAMKRGAFDFVTKPLNLERLEIIIKRALQSRNLEKENKQLHERLDRKYSFDGIIGSSSAHMHALEQVKQVAPSKATVMLYGETGTGKELFAQLVHQNSNRPRGPFVPVHCAALPANLLESELFGHEKGAFTGAIEKRIGRFESADGGTLFLDEIGEIDASTQVKLLRFLESKTFERVGSTKSLKVDVRLVCATNRNLLDMVKKGEFREDLYYRLDVVNLTLPPLRARKDDIPLLLDHYLKYFAQDNEVEPPQLATSALNVLVEYRWPGNIRELRNFAENIVVMKRGSEVTEYDLDMRFINPEAAEQVDQKQPLPATTKALSKTENEKRMLRAALVEARGNRSKAADLMGISRRTLYRKMQQWPELDIDE